MSKNKKQAIACIISAAFFFALMNLFVKLSGDLPVWQKSMFRNLVAMFIALFVVIKERTSIKLEKKNFLPMAVRCLAGTVGVICNFYAIGKLNIADASMLNKLSPFFAVIFSVFIMREKPKKVEWAAIIIAFIGALFVIKPTFNMDSFPAIMGVISGMGAGLAYACVRKLGTNGVAGPVIVFFFSMFSCLSVLPCVIFTYKPMSALQLAFLVMAGLSAAGGQFSITAAYSKAPAKEISVFDYTQVLFAAMLSFVFLGDLPDWLSFLGYAIIIGVAVFKWKYESLKQ
ncbi:MULTISPECIES: DMT family transporter [unclassified Ruminococcus]|uniref:DMT family transporter n=1 Tax=unclassified Ruminococcus TaxID=2608920 RepID=UPI00210DEF71|nr:MULTISPECIES: DMT family transporter [unclassified Ruminococcus]MCQ4021808.1 EamA family transporter [Ruminococcus sp. zg-924]MCQ4114253.1 EamA family transporter [Ruminococcus sp. zg-921]